MLKCLSDLPSWVPVVISAMSLLISFATIAERLYTNRVNINMTALRYLYYNDLVSFCIMFENKSRLPISITRIQVFDIESNLIDVEYTSRILSEYTGRRGDEITYKEYIKSLQFPIELHTLGAISGYLVADYRNIANLPLLHDKPLSFVVSTNRGMVEITGQTPEKVDRYYT